MPDNVSIKVTLDTADAQNKARELESSLRRMAGAANIPLGASGGGGGAGGAVAGGAGLLGAGIGRLLGLGSAAALGAMALGPLAQDIGSVGSGLLSPIGRGVSSFLGIQGMAGSMRAVDRAAEMVTAQLGPTKGVSDATINQLLETYKRMFQPMEDNRNRVENLAGVKKAEVVLDKLSTSIDNLNETLRNLGGKRG